MKIKMIYGVPIYTMDPDRTVVEAVVIADGKMKVHDGEYPSPDITFKGSSKLISDVFTDRRNMGEAMESWQLVVLGAGHEGFALEQLITTMMLEA